MDNIDTARIAEILGVSREHVTDRLTKRTDFPKPTVDVSRKLRRWDKDDVLRWRDLRTCDSEGDRPDPPVESGPDLLKTLRAKLEGAQRRSRLRGRPCVLVLNDLLEMHARQQGACAVTGITFDLTEGVGGPFAPSIDRIDCTKGYEHGNIRLVCHAVNLMMNRWGDVVFEKLIRKLAT